MSGFKQKGPLFYILAVLVLGVWGLLVYRLWIETGMDPEHELNVAPSVGPLIDAVPVRTDQRNGYRTDFRSPFVPPASLFERPAAETSDPIPDPPAPPVPPSLTLLGIIDHTAIISDTTGEIHFVCKGQSVANTQIHKVTRDQVVIVFEGHRFILAL